MFEIVLDKQPEQFLLKCEKDIFERITNKIEILKQNPVPQKSKRIIGYEHPTFRLRIGNYRVLYRINYENRKRILVKVDKREKVYDWVLSTTKWTFLNCHENPAKISENQD